MLLSFWINLYIWSVFILYTYFLLYGLLNTKLIIILTILICVLFIILVKKKFKIPFFSMFFNFGIIIFGIIGFVLVVLHANREINYSATEKLIFYFSSFFSNMLPFFILCFFKFLKHIINSSCRIIHIVLNIINIIICTFSIVFFFISYAFIQS